jgi:hypothetical protein
MRQADSMRKTWSRQEEEGGKWTDRDEGRKSAKISFSPSFFNGFFIDFIIDHYLPGIRWLILLQISRTFPLKEH